MKHLLIVLCIAVASGFCLAQVRSPESLDPGRLATKDSIETVEGFWADALVGGDYGRYLTGVPAEFEESMDCEGPSEPSANNELSMHLAPDWGMKGLKNTADIIRKEQLNIIETRVLRQASNQAIVFVKSSKTFREFPKVEISNEQYFFLIRKGDGWKIFLQAYVPDSLNKGFANPDCIN